MHCGEHDERESAAPDVQHASGLDLQVESSSKLAGSRPDIVEVPGCRTSPETRMLVQGWSIPSPWREREEVLV